jgi:PAS domain-containing protein
MRQQSGASFLTHDDLQVLIIAFHFTVKYDNSILKNYILKPSIVVWLEPIGGFDMKNDRKPKEKTIEAPQADFRSLFEQVGCGVYISSKEGKLIAANQTLIDMLGYESKSEFLAIDMTFINGLRIDASFRKLSNAKAA